MLIAIQFAYNYHVVDVTPQELDTLMGIVSKAVRCNTAYGSHPKFIANVESPHPELNIELILSGDFKPLDVARAEALAEQKEVDLS